MGMDFILQAVHYKWVVGMWYLSIYPLSFLTHSLS